jgi:hypothetical protein
MARPQMRWLIALNPLDCRDQGEGSAAEPYLWTIFFKCDGSSLMVSDAGKIEGSALIFPTPGSHGNLNDDSVHSGDSVFIPARLGLFADSVLPIPVAPSIQPLLKQEDLPGFFGVITVLMEEDNVTDDGAEAGHQALNAAVHTAVDAVLHSLGAGHTSITQEDIDSVTKGIDEAVRKAVRKQQNIFENIWSWVDPDDQIGNKTFVFNQDQFATPNHPEPRVGSLGLSYRWRHPDHGDWEIHGAMALTQPCMATSTASILSRKESELVYRGGESEKFSRQLSVMRSFRDNHFHRYSGLQDWWNIATKNTPQMAYLMMHDPKMRKSASALFRDIENVLNNLDAPLPKESLDHALRLTGLAKKSDFRGLRLDANRLEAVLQKLKPGSTGQDALNLFEEFSPKRSLRKEKR